MQFKTNIRIRY